VARVLASSGSSSPVLVSSGSSSPPCFALSPRDLLDLRRDRRSASPSSLRASSLSQIAI
jgi:hypothetical protein